MLKNFVTDQSLKLYHPKLNKQLWNEQLDYSNQINEAFQRVLVDVSNKGISPRLLMTPFDLVESVSAANAQPAYTTITVDTTGDSFIGDRNYKRLVLNVASITGTWTAQLQGSDDNTNFVDISAAEIVSSTIGELSTSFASSYAYWRYVFTNTTVVGADSNRFQCYLLEDIWDRLIVYKTFTIVFADFRRAQNDSWDLLFLEYDKAYNSLLDSIKFMYDSDESGSITEGEEYGNVRPTFYV